MRYLVLDEKTSRRLLTLLITLSFLWGGFLSSAGADSGFLTGLSLTPAPGAGPNDIDFTIRETTLTVTSYSPTAAVTFNGTLNFGDGSAPVSGFPLDVEDFKFRRGKGDVDVRTTESKGVVSHTYPAPGTYTAVLTHCCLAEIVVTTSGYLTITTSGTPLTDTVEVTVGAAPPGECAEPTLFKQIACLLGGLSEDVGGAGIDPALTGSLQDKLGNASEKNTLVEEACVEGNLTLASFRLSASRASVNSFISGTESNKGPTKRISDDVGDDFLTQAETIKGLQTGLIDTNVCEGLNCLQDPPLASINCEFNKLITQVTGAGLDAKLTASLLKLLTDGQAKKEEAEELCAIDKEKQAAGKLKATRGKLKPFVNKVNQGLKKGTISQAVADAILLQTGVVSGKVDALLLAGVCS